MTADPKRAPWISVRYSDRKVGVGYAGGPAVFFIQHPDATPGELQQLGRDVAQALNLLDKEQETNG